MKGWFFRIFLAAHAGNSGFFMRSVLHFAIHTLFPATLLLYILGMLAIPCMPVPDAHGQAQAVPRWEFWTIHMAYPSAIWWQWTGGLQPISILDRVPIFLGALVWLSMCGGLGWLILRCEHRHLDISRWQRHGIAILLGHSLLAALVFCNASIIGTQSVLPLCILLVTLGAGIFWIGNSMRLPFAHGMESDERDVQRQSQSDVTVSPNLLPLDLSLSHTAYRRLVGILTMSCMWLASVQVYGAAIPTQDQEVRESDWWLARHAMDDRRLHFEESNYLVHAPSPTAMSIIAITQGLQSIQAPMGHKQESWGIERRAQLQSLSNAALSAKVINAVLCVIGVLLVGAHCMRRQGLLPGLLIAFGLLATPGIAELTRLGRSECLIGVWGCALFILYQATNKSTANQGGLSGTSMTWWFLLAGACSLGYEGLFYVGLPAAVYTLLIGKGFQTLWEKSKAGSLGPSRLGRIVLFLLIAMTAGSVYLRNTLSSSDPIYPYGQAMVQRFAGTLSETEMNSLLRASSVPWKTLAESAHFDDANGVETPANRSAYRMANVIDGVFRILWNSSAHGLLLIPLVFLGLVVGRRLGRWDRDFAALIPFGLWIAIWWCMSTRLDRGWMGALWLLALPAAVGAQWLMENTAKAWLVVATTIAIAWSIVVIPIWPTSDNRLLVAIETIRMHSSEFHAPDNSKSDEEHALQGNFEYARAINRLVDEGVLGEGSKVLLIGECDDFDLLCKCECNGPFNRSLWVREQDYDDSGLRFEVTRRGITHVYFVWTGVQEAAVRTGEDGEPAIRKRLNFMRNQSQLTSIPLEINSSAAELFRVNED
jgi:hypothetical protein